MTTRIFDRTLEAVVPKLGNKGVEALSVSLNATEDSMLGDAKVTQAVTSWLAGDHTFRTVMRERMIIVLEENPERFPSPKNIVSRILNTFNRNDDRDAISKVFNAIYNTDAEIVIDLQSYSEL